MTKQTRETPDDQNEDPTGEKRRELSGKASAARRAWGEKVLAAGAAARRKAADKAKPKDEPEPKLFRRSKKRAK